MRKNGESGLISCYFMYRNQYFQETLFNVSVSVHRDNIKREGYLESIVHVSQVSMDETFRRHSFHDMHSIKFFVFLRHLEEKQQ